MNTHAEKASETKSTSMANGSPKRQPNGRTAVQLADKRPEATALMKMQELANDSPQVSRLRALQQLASNSPQVSQLRSLQVLANNSPKAKQATQLQALADATSPLSMQQKIANGIAQLALESSEEDELIQAKLQTAQRKPNETDCKPIENKTGLPDNLKTGIESLSGMSLDHVKVHYNSTQPAQLNALAYAQGNDIHLAPGQERHLPHEAWHVVQQAQGRVQPTLQMKDGVPVNDDAGLEREADVMGAKALAPAAQFAGEPEDEENLQGKSAAEQRRQSGHVNVSYRPSVNIAAIYTPNQTSNHHPIQLVRGGIEYTEDGPTMMYAYVNKPYPNNVLAHNTFAVGAQVMTGFRVGAGVTPNITLGAPTNHDHDVAQTSGNVKVTNDVKSSEWIIERHHADVTAPTMRQNLKADMSHMFTARDALASAVEGIKSGHAGEAAIATGNFADTNAAPQVYIYKVGPKKGKAQITAQYSNEDTIRRINKLNISKFLTGTKSAVGEDIPRVTGNASQALINADIAGTTSFSKAEQLLTGLRRTSLAIPLTAGGGNRLTAAQVGLIKLMVINDAIATTMVRYQAQVGQAQDKNIQRFFPKSRRDEYVKTIAAADLDATEMTALRAEIDRTSDADAQLVFDCADPGTLRVDEAFTELGGMVDPTMVGMLDARAKLADPRLGAPNPADLVNIKTAVLGANGSLLSIWITIASHAYTDMTPGASEHTFHHPGKVNQTNQDIIDFGAGNGGYVGNVLETSRGFTPVAGGRGAIYEMREREIEIDKSGIFNIGSMDEMNRSIDQVFNAAG